MGKVILVILVTFGPGNNAGTSLTSQPVADMTTCQHMAAMLKQKRDGNDYPYITPYCLE